MRKCISPRLPQQHEDGGKEGKKGGENKQTHLERGNRREGRRRINKQWKKREKKIVKGGHKREAAENRKHSVCKSQIKSISVLHTEPSPKGANRPFSTKTVYRRSR